MAVKVSFEYAGMIDYWSGNGRRWDDNAGCLFTFYGPDTTLADIVDGLVSDFMQGGDCDRLPPEVESDMIREAIMTGTLNDAGRADVASGALVWCAEGCEDDDEDMESPMFVALVEVDICPDCGAYVEDDCANDDGLCDACADKG